MTNSLKKQICDNLLNLQGFFAESIERVLNNDKEEIHMHIKKSGRARCPSCNALCSTHDTRIRLLQHSAILLLPVVLKLELRRTKCTKCGVLTEDHNLADNNKQHTNQFEEQVLEYTNELSNSSTAKLLGTSTSTIYRVDRIALEKKDLDLVSKVPRTTRLSLDETSFKKRHNYVTVIANQEDGRIIDISKGKSKNSATSILSKYDKANKFNWLETISIDFSQSYISAVSDFYAPSYIVFDKFHFSRIVNRKMELIRREIQKELPDAERYKIKKHVRWLILRRHKNYEDKHHKRLSDLMELNNTLYQAYLLKEDLLSIFDEGVEKEEAEISLINWCKMIQKTDFTAFKSLAKLILKRMDLLLNWFKYKISNAKAEAINNKIKTTIKMAYGFKDYEYFRLKILQRCGYLMR